MQETIELRIPESLEGETYPALDLDTSKITTFDSGGAFVLRDVGVSYGGEMAIAGVSFDVVPQKCTALIGPSGCGKSTILRCLNRMNDTIPGAKVHGSILLDGEDIHGQNADEVDLRTRVGQVFQYPNPFPMSIYENIAYGPRIQGIKDQDELDAIVEDSLTRAALWTEVKDSLKKHAFGLSGGQRQRLCIARALANKPEVLLMDEPASALDPISTQMIEDTITKIKDDVTIVIVTHSMSQASRVSDYTAFFLRDDMSKPAFLVEYGYTPTMFNRPKDERTQDYITGRFG